MEIPKDMPADAESQVVIYRQYAADLSVAHNKLISENEQLKENYRQALRERDKYKLKWEIETERYDNLIEKMMERR